MSSARDKKQRCICVLIAYFVLVSGMYFENIKVDSAFVCAPTETTNAYVFSLDTGHTATEACTTEMLGVRQGAGFQEFSARFANQRKDTKIASDDRGQSIIALKNGVSYAILEKIEQISEFQEKLVTNYIHKSDGKKRI